MEGLIVANTSPEVKFMIWCCSSLILLLAGAVVYLWKQNNKIKDDKQNAMILSIKESIDNLGTTITAATHEFKATVEDIWDHIGDLREEVSWLTGQHEANHSKDGEKVIYRGEERRKIPRRPKPE